MSKKSRAYSTSDMSIAVVAGTLMGAGSLGIHYKVYATSIIYIVVGLTLIVLTVVKPIILALAVRLLRRGN